MRILRRTFLFGSLASSSLWAAANGTASAAEEAIEITWSDLRPEDGGTELDVLRDLGIVQHGQMSSPFDQETAAVVTEEYNGKVVRIPGYLVPLEFDGTGVTAAILVPYVGACVHVPPPPPNQLIFISSPIPYESGGLFEPVSVTGTFGTSATQTELAEIGYVIMADRIEPYG